MILPNAKTPADRWHGAGACETDLAKIKAKTTIGQSHDPACQRRLNPSGCLICRRFDRIARGIDARRARIAFVVRAWAT